MSNFVIADFDDWQVLYGPSGHKIMEGHSLNLSDVLREVGADCKVLRATAEYDATVSDEGCVPETLAEFPGGWFDGNP